MLLTLCACCFFALLALGLVQLPRLRERSESLSRATTYNTYSPAREDTLSNADLWERKVDQGFSNDEALVYTALRPNGSSTLALVDSAKRLRTSWHRNVNGYRVAVFLSWSCAAAILVLASLTLWSWLGARRRLTGV
jgi:hypothetical protein